MGFNLWRAEAKSLFISAQLADIRYKWIEPKFPNFGNIEQHSTTQRTMPMISNSMVIQNTKMQNVIRLLIADKALFGCLLNRLPDPDPDDVEYIGNMFLQCIRGLIWCCIVLLYRKGINKCCRFIFSDLWSFVIFCRPFLLIIIDYLFAVCELYFQKTSAQRQITETHYP